MTSGWQVVIEDPSYLSGSSFRGVASALSRQANARFVTCRDVDGGGESISQLSAGMSVMTVDELLAISTNVVQFDWGDLFFCTTKVTAESIAEDESYATALAKAAVTLRCVDDTYFYIYGTDPRMFSEVCRAFPIAETKQGELSELDYPQ